MGLDDQQQEPQQQGKLEVPSYFKCPISLCLMSDPVSICTGITYDRASIEKWFEEGRRTCPVTMQALDSQDLIPNHTLRRIIETWCAANQMVQAPNRRKSSGGGNPVLQKQKREQQDESEQQAMDLRAAKMLLHQLQIPSSRKEAVKRVRKDLETNRKMLNKAGLGPVLVSVFSAESASKKSKSSEEEEEDLQAQILNLLSQLIKTLDESSRKDLVSAPNLAAIAWLLQRGDLPTRINAASLLEDLCCADREARLEIGSTPGIFEGFVRLIREDSKHRPAIRASLRSVLAVCPPMKNRVRLVESGAVAPLVELLLDSDKGTTEAVLAVLECLCGCAEGRAAVSRHALAIPVVTKKLFKASDMATEYAIDVLWAVCKYCPDEGVRKRMVEVGLFPKLFFFLQIGCNPRTKHKAGDLLKLLHRAYRECIEGNDNNNTCLLTA